MDVLSCKRGSRPNPFNVNTDKGDGIESEEPDADVHFCLWLVTLKDVYAVCTRRSPEAIQLNGTWRSTPITAI